MARTVPEKLRAEAAEMLADDDSLHRVSYLTGLSKPYLTKLRDKIKLEDMHKGE